MLSDEEKEIFKNLKEYMQNNINNGYHKFVYNDLGWDFKCIDCINAIDKVLNQSKEIEELKEDRNKFKKRDYISKKKLNKKIEDFKIIRDTIIQNENDLNRPMMTYDLKRNDYCIKMLESLLNEE